MPSTARAAEASAYKNVRANPFTRIHGRPTQGDYEIIKHEAATQASEVEDITYAWSRDPVTGDEYGLLAKILGLAEYDHQTDKRNSARQHQIIEPIMASASSQRVQANQ